MRDKLIRIMICGDCDCMFPRKSDIDDKIVFLDFVHFCTAQFLSRRDILLESSLCMAAYTNTPISVMRCWNRIGIW